MKKIMVLVILITLGLTLIPNLYAQEEGPGGEGGMVMHKMMRPGMRGTGKTMVTPERVAGYDEKTKAAWREIKDLEIKVATSGYLGIAAAVAIGLAAFGGALGQGRAAAAALEGIARNPEVTSKISLWLIISMALIESLVIYALVIAFLLHGKI